MTMSVSEMASELASSPSMSDTSLYTFKSLRPEHTKFTFLMSPSSSKHWSARLWRTAISPHNGWIAFFFLGGSYFSTSMWGVFLITIVPVVITFAVVVFWFVFVALMTVVVANDGIVVRI